MASPAPRQPVAGPSSEPKASMLKRMGGPSDLKAGVGRGGIRTAEEIQHIVHEVSKGSKYFKDQERRDRELQVKVDKLKGRLAQEELTARGDEEDKADAILKELEETRDLSRVIALIDADAFYAACHVRVNPELEGKAFGVGGGMLTTASYEARKYGCRSAMPFFIAQKLCPHLVSLKLEPDLYVKASRDIFAVLSKYGTIAPASLDEAYVDLTQYCADQDVTPTEAITRLRAEVQATTGLTVSAGVSPNKTLSKIAADVNKPNGQFVIDPTREACMEFIQGVRLRKCFGIGRVCETLLNGIGLETVGDIFRDRAKLYLVRHHLGQSAHFRFLLGLYLGLGRNRVKRAKRGDRKTYGVEKTFTPTSDPGKLDDVIRRVAKSLAKDLKRADFSGRTVTLRIKHADFVSVTRAHTPGKNIYLRDYKDLVRIGLMLLHKEIDERPKLIARGEEVKGGRNPVLKARLLGLRVGNLRDERALAKANKLDGWVRVSSRSTPEIELSDSETDVQRDSDLDDDEDEDDDEADPGKRALNAVMRDAAIDPFADAGDGEGGVKKEDAACDPAAFGGASGSGSGSWMCVDDYDNDAEDEDAEVVRGRFGVHRGATVPKPSQRRAQQPSSSTIVQGSSLAAASRAGSPPKRKSPAAEDASANEKGKKRRIRKEEEEAAKPASGNEWTCPVCDKVFAGSEAAMSGHVAKHFADDEPPARPKVKVKKECGSLGGGGMGGSKVSSKTKVKGKGRKG